MRFPPCVSPPHAAALDTQEISLVLLEASPFPHSHLVRLRRCLLLRLHCLGRRRHFAGILLRLHRLGRRRHFTGILLRLHRLGRRRHFAGILLRLHRPNQIPKPVGARHRQQCTG